MAKVNDGDLVLATGEKVVTEKVDARSSAGLLLQDDGGNYIKINDGGIVDISKQSCVRAYLGSDQSVPTATVRKAYLGSENFDVHGEFDNSTNYRFTATKAGYYVVIGKVDFIGLNNGNRIHVYIRKNGSTISIASDEIGNASSPCIVTSKICYLAVNDYIELWGYHNYGSNRYFDAGSGNTSLAIHKLS
jgi:hypothetical protein